MDESCCLCPRPAVDLIDEQFPVCASCADALSRTEPSPEPWESGYEYPADALMPDAALALLAVGAA